MMTSGRKGFHGQLQTLRCFYKPRHRAAKDVFKMKNLIEKKYARLIALREKLALGGNSIGSWMQLPSAEVAEILSAGDFDWIAVDWEHGAFDVESLSKLFRAMELNDCLPFVRLPRADETYCKWALDAGAVGLIVPMVRSKEDVENVISWSTWPITGRRGVGFSRANLFGAHFEEYKGIARAPFMVPIIENKDALESLVDIATVPGVDALFVGPYDLSASLGCMGDFENKRFAAAMTEISTICKNLNKPFGLHIVHPDPNELKRVRDMGYRFNAYSLDTVMLAAQIKNLDL